MNPCSGKVLSARTIVANGLVCSKLVTYKLVIFNGEYSTVTYDEGVTLTSVHLDGIDDQFLRVNSIDLDNGQ